MTKKQRTYVVFFGPIFVFVGIFLYHGIRAKIDLIDVIPTWACLLLVFGCLGWSLLMYAIAVFAGEKE